MVEEHAEDGVHFQYQSDYDLLLMVKSRSTSLQHRLEYETMAEIEKISEVHTPVSIIVHDIEFINRRLEKAQYFFSDIKKQGILLYDSGQLTLAELKELSHKERYHLAKDDFEYYFGKTKNLISIFQFCFDNKNYNEAAFELHQVVE